MTQAISINGALEESLSVKLQARIPRKLNIKPNKNKKIKPFDQEKNPYCTAFASAGAWLYNHGKQFTNLQIYNWCHPILNWKGARTSDISKKFAEWQWGNQLVMTIFSSTAEAILDAGYALIISTRCPAEFWTDGIVDGVVNGKDYKPKLDWGHAIVLIKKNGKYYLVNSWGNYELKDKFNTYEIDAKILFKSGLIRSECFFIF